MKNNKYQPNLRQIISIHLLVWLISVGFAFGQTQDDRKLELIVQTGHSGSAQSVVFSPDGKHIASGGLDSTIKIWSSELKQEVRTIYNAGVVESIVFSPNGRFIVSGSNDGLIKIWNVITGMKIKVMEGHSDMLWSISFSPNGKYLVSSSRDKTTKIWDFDTGKPIRTIPSSYVTSSVIFSPDGHILVSAEENIIKLRNAETGTEIKNFYGHLNTINSIAFSPDGKQIVSGSLDTTIKLWETESGTEIKTLHYGSGSIWSVKFSPNGKYVASSIGNNIIKIWDAKSGAEIKTLNGQINCVSIDFSPDSKQIVGGGWGGIELWNVESGVKNKIRFSHSNPASYIAFLPDRKSIIIANDVIKWWDIENVTRVGTLKDTFGSITSVALSPDGKRIASTSWDNAIKLWDVSTSAHIRTLKGDFNSVNNGMSNQIRSVAFSLDGKLIAGGSWNNTIKIWEVETGLEIRTLQSRSGSVMSVTFSSDGKQIISASLSWIQVWNISTGNETKAFQQNPYNLAQVVVSSPDGKHIASIDNKKIIKLWSIETGLEIKNFQGNSVSFSPDGKTIAISNDNNIIEHWNIETGTRIGILNGHSDLVLSLGFSSDGKLFISGSLDRTIKIWNLETNKELASLIALDENDWAIVTPDGRFDASEGALKLMHYAYGLEIIDLEQLKEMYYEPGLLQKLLGFSKEPLRTIVPLKDVKLYPEIVEQKFDEKTGKLNIKLKNRGGGIGRTEVFVNDKRVVEDARDEKLKKNPNIALDATVDLAVDLPASAFVKGAKNEIKVITSNFLKEIGKGNIQSRGTAVFYLDKNKAETELPNLYAIVGGVSDYDGDALDLNFAAKDAEDFSNALRLGANRLFCPQQTPDCLNKINITTLSTARENPNEQPTKENFKKAFAEIAAKAKPEDILVVYLSGHGVTLGTGTDTYFYLTKEARSASREDLAKTFQTAAISNEELTDWLTPNDKNPNDIWVNTGKQVIILDTCAAGNFAENDWKKDRDLSGDQIRAIDFLSKNTGTFILMGSAANRPSYEANRYNQGLLTFALLEGMKGLALQPPNGYINVGLLFDYATRRVPELAGEINLSQNPIIKVPDKSSPFPFGQITDEDKSKINLPKLKPMLLRPRFGSGEENDDPLNLVAELRKRFDAESSYEVMKRSGKGEPLLIYVDDDSFPGAVRVTGTYTIEGENVRVKAFLRQDGKTIANFEIAATKDKIADEIMTAVRTELGKPAIK